MNLHDLLRNVTRAVPSIALPCGGISDLLSYEMIRVAAAPEPAKLTRAANAKLAHLGCMADD